MSSLRVAILLSGLGRVQRGAEAAFLELARRWVERSGASVTLFGMGEEGLPAELGREVIKCRPRERFEGWPSLPTLYTEYYYEELSFVWNLARSGRYKPADFDVVLSCTYPWVNWYLQRTGRRNGPLNIYVTQNGDWPSFARSREGRWFHCDGMVCTNPVYYERNRERYPSVLIPNGVDPERFRPPESGGETGPDQMAEIGQMGGKRLVLMASAMIPSKDVAGGVRAVAQVPDAFLVVVGDGPERARVTALAEELLPGRHRLLGSVPRERMPALFRQADVFLHMSRDEPFGLVYLEAASTALPLVVHDWDVTRWMLGDTVIGVDTASPEATAVGIQQALDPETAKRLGNMARQRVLEGWTWQVAADRYLAFFEEQLATRSEG